MVPSQHFNTRKNMVISELKWLDAELMDIVRLFPETEETIFHDVDLIGAMFRNVFRFGASEYRFEDIDVWFSETEKKSLIKRYAKLGLYRILSELHHKTLPWGSLTGIRPTRLAYQHMEKAARLAALGGEATPFEALFEKLGVSAENIALTARVIEGQRGIYERKKGNSDLFVSIPFCPTKCVYCSFITAPIAATGKYMPAYLDCLEREFEATMSEVGHLRSVYVGGGTPFVLQPDELARVLKMLSPAIRSGVEFTVEAGRPDTFTEEKLDLCKQYGVTRICINAQSFSDRTLAAIGRKHTAEDVVRAFEMARPYGFDVNCDLIAGLTGESFAEFENSVETAIALGPENITVHTLCLKKGARLKEETATLSEGGMSEMIAISREKLTAAGYEPYYLYRQKYMAGAHENVGWTKPGKACVYNIDVMEEIADNPAIGANAVSKKVFLDEGRIERIGSPKDIPTYLQKTDRLIEEKRALFGAGPKADESK